MLRQTKIAFTSILTIFLVTPLLLLSYAGGPDPGTTAGPGENASGCAQAGCHTGAANPTRGSGIEIDFPNGASYTPGVKQTIKVRVTGATGNVYGFQLAARLANGNAQAGTLAPLNSSVQILCQDGRTPPCRADASVQYATHRMATTSNAFDIEWTPPATDSGNVRFYVAANAANGNGQNTGDRIFIRDFTVTPQAGGGGGAAPQLRTEQPVLPAFSGKTGISSGMWLEIYGTNLSTATREWAGGDFNGNTAPTSLDGVRVNIDGKPAFVRFISPTQINVQAPDGVGSGSGIAVEVINANGSSRATTAAGRVSPALLTTPNFNVGGRQYLAALHADFRTFVGRENLIPGVAFRPARPGDTIIVFAVGCGPTNPASPAGQFFNDARPLSSPFQFQFGQTIAQAQGFLAAGAVGLCQFNVTVPNVAAGDVAVTGTVDGTADGQSLFTTVQP